MKNKKRVEQIESKANMGSGNQSVFIFPSGIYEEKEIVNKVIEEVNKHPREGGVVILLPDNGRDAPDKKLNKIMRKVIIREGREDLLKFIRSE